MLRSAVGTGVRQLQIEVERSINIRRRDLDDQIAELRSLRGKNSSVSATMRSRIEAEQKDFEASAAKIRAIRNVHLKLLRDLFNLLGSSTLKQELLALNEALVQKGPKLGVRRIYAHTFARLNSICTQAQTAAQEIQSMLAATYKDLNAEFGFSLQPPPSLNFS